jgi:predicted house-cleaning noncanonical NTP pyrophosphatase (MazG superfamily)
LQHEKLIRDLVPSLAHTKLHTRIAAPEELPKLLGAKLVEEAAEFAAEPSLEELADVLEVLDAILVQYNWTPAQLFSMRQAKADTRGAFRFRVVLVTD